MDSSWLFNLGADIYAWFTAQPAWRSSCERLAAPLADLNRPWIADLGCVPGVSTFELARQLRSNRELESMRLIAVTGYGKEHDRERTQAAGFDAHLVKPVDVEEVSQLILKLASEARE